MAGFLLGPAGMIEVLNAQRCRYLAKRRLLGVTHLDAATEGKNYIETVWGRGYVLREPPEDLKASA